MNNETRYTVTTLRVGQPRPYANSEYEYVVKVERLGMYGEPAGIPVSGILPGDHQRDWCKKIIKALCHDFREADDDDGLTGMDAHFAPTLKWLNINPEAGTIHALIIEAYTD